MDEEIQMNEQLQEALDQVTTIATEYGLSVVGAIVILIIGFWFAGFAKRSVRKIMDKSEKIDPTISIFVSSLVRYAIIVFTVMAVLDQFGVETTSFVAVIGAVGLAIGFALQGTLSNVASGIMLLFFRPFSVGHFVEAGGISGTIKGINLFSTELATPDNVQIIVPNGQIWGDAIKNFSFNPTRRVDMVMGISYDDDIDKAMAIIKDILDADERTLKDPEAVIAVGNLGDSSVDILVRPWCNAGDYWKYRWDVTKTIKETFDEKGISIPYPHSVVQMTNLDDK